MAAPTLRVDLSDPGMFPKAVTVPVGTDIPAWLGRHGNTYTRAVVRYQIGKRTGKRSVCYSRCLGASEWTPMAAFHDPAAGPKPGDPIMVLGTVQDTVRRAKRRDPDTGSYYVITEGECGRWVVRGAGHWVDQGH